MAVNEELLKKVLEEIRPNLQADGGDMEYVGVDDEGVVKLELQGACAGCPMSSLTLSMGIERILKEHVPGVTRVEQVNASGENRRPVRRVRAVLRCESCGRHTPHRRYAQICGCERKARGRICM